MIIAFLKQVNILIILFLSFGGWSSQTILVTLLNKESNLGFLSWVNITSSCYFFFLLFSPLQLVLCKGWLICWFSNYFNYLVRCSMEDFIFLFKVWINATYFTLATIFSTSCMVAGFISGISIISRQLFSVSHSFYLWLWSYWVCIFLVWVFFCAGLWWCTMSTSEINKQTNLDSGPRLGLL